MKQAVAASFILLILNGAITAQQADQVFSGAEILDAPFVGLKPVSVSVSMPETDLERYGLSRSAVQTDLELKLRQAGVSVAPAAPSGGKVRVLILSVPLQTGIGSTVRYGFYLEVGVVRDVSIPGVRVPVLHATVWRVGGTIATDLDHLSSVRDKVRDYFDQFLNAYLTANPK